MSENSCDNNHKKHYSGGGDVVYGLGIIGAAIFFVGQSSGIWTLILALLKALIWPVFFVLEAFKFFAS